MNSKASRWGQLILIFPFAALMGTKGTFFLSELAQELGKEFSTAQNLLGVFVFYVIAGYIYQLIYMTGRLLGGWLSGYHVLYIQIFNLTWSKIDQFRFRWKSGFQMHCSCRMTPPEEENGKHPAMLYVLSGVIFSGIAGIVFLVISSEFSERRLFSTVTYFVSMFCLMFSLVYGIPMQRNHEKNPGYRALELTRHPNAPRAACIAQKILKEYMRGTRIKDMPADWFEIPSPSEMENFYLAHIGAMACERLMDEHRFVDADRLAAQLLQVKDLSSVQRRSLVSNRIFCELIGENRSEVIAKLMTPKCKKLLQQASKYDIDALKTLYTYALLHEGDIIGAEHLRTEFKAQAGKKYSISSVYENWEQMAYATNIAVERGIISITEKENLLCLKPET